MATQATTTTAPLMQPADAQRSAAGLWSDALWRLRRDPTTLAAIAVVVSEETGNISLANAGRMVLNLSEPRLRKVLSILERGAASSNGRGPGPRPIPSPTPPEAAGPTSESA